MPTTLRQGVRLPDQVGGHSTLRDLFQTGVIWARVRGIQGSYGIQGNDTRGSSVPRMMRTTGALPTSPVERLRSGLPSSLKMRDSAGFCHA
ncbi:hypothetical protein DPEC_G00119980 [Dallia pectoralis]|uniref:Uncharacterized protein n=1 Tax=Dallia pectoralis TaxID=75939 RepID=A0ACC2GQB3_DALPE|nr:hypothetical protein DPEC_G00119980 [Dallia pectoralis]